MADIVLVTGGSGFIGSHLCRMLIERGDKVINFDVYPRRGPLAWLVREVEREIVFEKGDVANLTQLIAVLRKYKPNKIAHLAASIDMDSIESHPKQVYDQMVGGTVNVLEGMRLFGGVELRRIALGNRSAVLCTSSKAQGQYQGHRERSVSHGSVPVSLADPRAGSIADICIGRNVLKGNTVRD